MFSEKFNVIVRWAMMIQHRRALLRAALYVHLLSLSIICLVLLCFHNVQFFFVNELSSHRRRKEVWMGEQDKCLVSKPLAGVWRTTARTTCSLADAAASNLAQQGSIFLITCAGTTLTGRRAKGQRPSSFTYPLSYATKVYILRNLNKPLCGEAFRL